MKCTKNMIRIFEILENRFLLNFLQFAIEIPIRGIVKNIFSGKRIQKFPNLKKLFYFPTKSYVQYAFNDNDTYSLKKFFSIKNTETKRIKIVIIGSCNESFCRLLCATHNRISYEKNPHDILRFY